MPAKGTIEYDEPVTNPDKVFSKTITTQLQTLVGVSLIEILSTHSSDEMRSTLDKETLNIGHRMQSHWKHLTNLERNWKKLKKEL